MSTSSVITSHSGLLIAASLLGLALSSCTAPDQAAGPPQMPPPPVATAAPLSQPWAQELETSARFTASEQVLVRPQASGRIVEVLVADGARVQTGDILFRLEDTEAQADLALAKAQLRGAESRQAGAEAQKVGAEAQLLQAQARLQVAEQRERRNRPLIESNVVAERLLDDIEGDLAVARATVSAAEAAIRNAEAAITTAKADQTAALAAVQVAEVDLAYTTITAPIDGRVGRILVTKGNVVNGGGQGPEGTHLVTIISDRTIDVTTALAEQLYLEYAELLHAALANPEVLSLSVDLGTGADPIPARLHLIDNEATPGSGVVRLVARLDNPDGLLIPGVFTRVRFQLGPKTDVLMVHERAVQAMMNGRFVYTVGEGGVTAITPVELGDRVGSLRVVHSGLKGDEAIALTNLKKIFFPGMPVAPIPGDMANGTALATPAEGAQP